MCTALAAPNTADLAHPTEAGNVLNTDTPLIRSDADGQLNRRQDKPSKVGAVIYSDRDCNGYLGEIDDFTQSPGKTYLPQGDGLAYSFELLYRGLQGQEQLDISTKNPSSGDPCGDFTDSYFAGTSTSCNNWGDITCFRFWNNPGL